MQITIHKSGELLESTKQVIQEKVSKLETFYDRIERADVYIKEDDGNTANGHKVEVRLSIPGNDLFAEHTDASIKRGIAEVTEALRRQIKKHKEKTVDRDQAGISHADMAPSDDEEEIIVSEEQL
ncbi:ribosome-associated translation inhibitor RaiA [Neolewinella lacunae]|uniref:Ribosome-associated translation inhibitor RaiA n=1 Tax=Neolewinella lacunae TaxID=1517758 RepID=A0A923T9P5_9BACT|nr:ribosome-associated translation inhibitor RaiA [Neolewinella lacunae]MBC6995278.1 ribosome-associated translation inhibitor RaiA [Neolewinella lacunae]MDN3635552.1 ribosome-associated translation inhibitor RaiA [Neolewinella lacunae]